jgi:DNA-binding MarR family transcriptional regulator
MLDSQVLSMTAEDERTSLRPTQMLSHAEYVALALFRQTVRRMCQDSEAAARKRGLTPQQHQTLLAIKAAEDDDRLSIGRLAERLGIRPHSAVELIDRLVQLRLVERKTDEQDHRRVRLSLTNRAQHTLDALADVHRRELQSLRPALEALLKDLETGRPDGAATMLREGIPGEQSLDRPE